MSQPINEGMLLFSYLNNIEQQNQILLNILETINRQNLSSRNLINSYVNPFTPRYRDNTFNRNWNDTLLSSQPRSFRSQRIRNPRNFRNNSIRRQNRRDRQNNNIPSNTTNSQTSQTTPPNIFLQTILNMLSPVRITPSAEQISNATENYTYRILPETPIRTRICPIDREPIIEGDNVTQINYCGHIFRSINLQTWFEHNSRCPLCRYDIRNYGTSSESNSTQDLSSNSIDGSGNFISNSSPAITHNTQTENINDLSNNIFNSFVNPLNITNAEADNFFSNILSNFSPNNLQSLNAINLDISGNTASLSFGVANPENLSQPNVD